MRVRQSAFFVGLVLIASLCASFSGTLAGEIDEDGTRTTPVVVLEGYNVGILDAYAVTEVVRILENPTEEPMDHTFVFQIPEGALISNFSIEVEGETYYADVLEKETAQAMYNEAVQSGNTAGLVASNGGDSFDYSVSFAPGERITATLRYEQMLLKQNGWHEYVLPFDMETYADPVGNLEITVEIEAPSEIADVVTRGQLQHITDSEVDANTAYVEYRAKDLKPSEDLQVRWQTGGGSPGGVMYFGKWGGSGYFLHVYDPDPALFGDEPLGKDFVFVVDRSGSMIGTKFEQSKEALGHIYNNLIIEDRFSLVQFDSRAIAYSMELVPADSTNIVQVRSYIDGMFIGGSTDIHEGLMMGLDIFKTDEGPVPVLVLLTDGRANSGLYHRSDFREDVLARNTVDAPIFSIALGNDADWEFVEALSMENDGRAIWVGENEDVVSVITDFVASFSTPLVSNLRFEYGPDVFDVHPSEVRAHYSGSEVLMAGRFSDISEVPMMLTATTGTGEMVTENAFPIDGRPAHDFVPRFWAFSRIKDLEERMIYNGTDEATVEEITNLAIEFHFVTDYTSLFVELPEDIQERFDNGDYPVAEGSAPELAYGEGDSMNDPPMVHSLPSTPDNGLGPTQSTKDSTPPRLLGTTDGDQDSDVSSDHSVWYVETTQADSQDTDGDGMPQAGMPQTRTASIPGDPSLDSDGLPDIEESYTSYGRHLKNGDQVILPGEQTPDVAAGSAIQVEGTAGFAVPWAALMIVILPMVTIICVIAHWFMIGHEIYYKKRL
ncbi:MAG: VIT and VWA domain-containing protein [Candidatus Thermoplasmatota archaeon]|nr:VIT and VWA domain-containing protein [Candidatus Thermoplasmatota archaeon]